LHCVLLIAEGRSCYEVARWFGEDPRTIERWVHALDEYGIEGLREHHAGGRPTKLADEHLQHLALDLQKPPSACGYPEQR
jgi:transposase